MSIIPHTISSHRSRNNLYMSVHTSSAETHIYMYIYAYAYIFQFQSSISM